MKSVIKKCIIFISLTIHHNSYMMLRHAFPTCMSARQVAQKTIEFYEKNGGQEYSKDITQIGHASQAYYLAKFIASPHNFAVGCLLHNFGNVVDSTFLDDQQNLQISHAELGAKTLEHLGYPEDVVFYAQYHYIATILLCKKNPKILKNLSPASQKNIFAQHEQLQSLDDNFIKKLTENKYFDNLLALCNIKNLATMPGESRLNLEEWQDDLEKALNSKADNKSYPKIQQQIERLDIIFNHYDSNIFNKIHL